METGLGHIPRPYVLLVGVKTGSVRVRTGPTPTEGSSEHLEIFKPPAVVYRYWNPSPQIRTDRDGIV